MAQWFDLAIQAFTFLAVFAVVNLAQRAIGSQLAVRRRLGGGDVSTPQFAEGSVLRDEKVRNPILLWVQSVTASGETKDTQKLRTDLSLAGFDQPSAPIWYVIVRFSLAIGGPVLLIGGLALAGRPLTGLGAFIFPLAICGLGLVAPKAVLDNRINARREQLEHEFPDALDLMVVCVEAGLGLEAAFVRVAAEVTESHPRIADEFGRLADELAAGRGRAEALRALAERLNVDSIRSFVALLIQTDLLGVSIGQSLRTYSAEMRETRFMKAEEKAMRIPVLMTVPIVACFMPVIMVALLLPPMIDVVRTLLPAMAGR
ncbi:type II secretion system F family protein [Phenylobacterium sp.]|uniref:type II secretion system F family protein n=1 Tax=Phenylobacterium sp. TaxID=1871053 RepID=UPI0025FC55E7|nr:type II secretion system F family protein [Phenylobacterium sp.]